ncbi:MAG: carbohydrate ABC transporter permease [Actinobacteria bacterium]|nr:carbohydrate ABC transporter permease [Actinomycetota bacterium]
MTSLMNINIFKKNVFGSLKHIVLILFVIIAVIPIIWIILTSLKNTAEVVVWPPIFFPKHPSFAAYLKIWDYAPFGTFLKNSVIVSLVAGIFTIICSSMAAYGLARLNLRGTKFILSAFLISQMFPGASIIIPVAQMVVKMGLYNTLTGLILIYTAFLIPFSTWMLYGYFRTIPKELEEAAFIDGCSRRQSLIKVILPLSIPGLGATFIFCFLGAWNEYLFALVFANDYTVRTLPVGLGTLIGQFNTSWERLSAAAIIFSIPPLILFLLLERSLVSGLTAGAMKE